MLYQNNVTSYFPPWYSGFRSRSAQSIVVGATIISIQYGQPLITSIIPETLAAYRASLLSPTCQNSSSNGVCHGPVSANRLSLRTNSSTSLAFVGVQSEPEPPLHRDHWRVTLTSSPKRKAPRCWHSNYKMWSKDSGPESKLLPSRYVATRKLRTLFGLSQGASQKKKGLRPLR